MAPLPPPGYAYVWRMTQQENSHNEMCHANTVKETGYYYALHRRSFDEYVKSVASPHHTFCKRGPLS